MKKQIIKTKYSNLVLTFHGMKSWICLVLSAASLLGCMAAGASPKAGLVLCALFLVPAFLAVDCTVSVSRWLNIAWCAGAGFTAVFLTQLLLNAGFGSIAPEKILYGSLCAGCLLMAILLVSMNFRITVMLGLAVPLLLSLINHFVFTFRGSELAPYDFLAFGTAANVAGNYSYRLEPTMVYAGILGILYCCLGFCFPKVRIKRTIRCSAACLALVITLLLGLRTGTAGIKAQHFSQMGTMNNGYLLNFYLQLRNTAVTKPADYAPEVIAELENRYQQDQDSGALHDVDVIIIMSEAFGDLSVLGEDPNTNIDVTPFFDTLRENSIHGYALCSGFGGGTSNSEYEFLTGNSLGLLPSGCFPFQQYVQEGSTSIISGLEGYGYSSMATHPASGQNWMRTTVYPRLGFDSYHFIEDYPRQTLLRDMVSDQEMFEQLIAWYESFDPAERVFLFGATMQNHSDYNYTGDDFETTVHLEGYDKEYPDVEQYLTLLNHSDQALESFIRYFKNVDNDVVLVFYGDHMPNLDTQFFGDLHGGAFDTLEEQMLQYTVPFFVWANYDIEERDVGLTSLNFLSSYVYEAAGLPMPAYNAFLQDVQDVIPAMNAFGYYSNSQGTFIPYEDAQGQEAAVLEQYRILQYNNLFDEENRSQVFFPAWTDSQ